MNKSETIREWALSKIGCPYIFAANGQKCTPAYRGQQMRNKSDYAANIQRYCPVLSGKQAICDGCKYKDKPSYDCSGLTKEAAALVCVKVPHGASSFWNGDYWDEKGTIDQIPRDKVCFVFNAMDSADPMGHVGIYLGDGYVVDARGHAYGVMHTKLETYAWDHYAILKGMKNEEGDVTMPDTPTIPADEKRDTIRQGAKGPTVVEMQGRLKTHGITVDGEQIKVDGVFGPITDAAIREFQRVNGLEIDGVCGPKTWRLLLADPWAEAPRVQTYTFTVPGMTASQAMAEGDRLRAAYGNCEVAVR